MCSASCDAAIGQGLVMEMGLLVGLRWKVESTRAALFRSARVTTALPATCPMDIDRQTQITRRR